METVRGDQLFTGVVMMSQPLDFSAMPPGNSVKGSIMTTRSNWITFPTPNARGIKLLLAYSGATGDFNTLCMRARSNSDMPVVCGNFSASAGKNDYGNLYAVQGYAQPNAYTQSVAANIVCGLYSCIDMGGATQAGRAWSAWIDTHTTKKAAASDFLCRLSHNGTATIDGVFTIYNGGRMPVLFNFEDAAGCVGAKVDADIAYAHYRKVACTVGGAAGWILLGLDA